MSDGWPIDGIDWRGDDDTSLRLEDGRVSGSAGINRLMGDYTLTDDRVSFGVIATTMMSGPPERMNAEQRFLGALGKVRRWSMVAVGEPEAGYSLTLADDDGVELLRLVAEPPA